MLVTSNSLPSRPTITSGRDVLPSVHNIRPWSSCLTGGKSKAPASARNSPGRRFRSHVVKKNFQLKSSASSVRRLPRTRPPPGMGAPQRRRRAGLCKREPPRAGCGSIGAWAWRCLSRRASLQLIRIAREGVGVLVVWRHGADPRRAAPARPQRGSATATSRAGLPVATPAVPMKSLFVQRRRQDKPRFVSSCGRLAGHPRRCRLPQQGNFLRRQAVGRVHQLRQSPF